jgi:uncharacterized protein YjbJ (UPF0337 family)
VNKNQINGVVMIKIGKFQARIGKLVGNIEQQTKGLNMQISGYPEKAFGDAIEIVIGAVRHS